MPKAKRSKVVSLTNTAKKGKQSKDSLVQNVSNASAYLCALTLTLARLPLADPRCR